VTEAFSDLKPLHLDVLYAATDDLRRFTESAFRSSQYETVYRKSRKFRLCIKKVRMRDMFDISHEPDGLCGPNDSSGIVRYVFHRIRLASLSGVTS